MVSKKNSDSGQNWQLKLRTFLGILKVARDTEDARARGRAGSRPERGISAPTAVSEARLRPKIISFQKKGIAILGSFPNASGAEFEHFDAIPAQHGVGISLNP